MRIRPIIVRKGEVTAEIVCKGGVRARTVRRGSRRTPGVYRRAL